MPESAGVWLYAGMALAAVVVLFVLVKLLSGGKAEAGSKSGTGRTSMEEFIQAAAKQGVSERVAREAYSLLAPRYGKSGAIALSDSLEKRLRMTAEQVSDMQGTLMRYTDRQIKVGAAGPSVVTVLDLLLTVETSTVRSVRGAAAPSVGVPPQAAGVPSQAAGATFVRPYRPEKK